MISLGDILHNVMIILIIHLDQVGTPKKSGIQDPQFLVAEKLKSPTVL